MGVMYVRSILAQAGVINTRYLAAKTISLST
jgi:hypothetical protein